MSTPLHCGIDGVGGTVCSRRGMRSGCELFSLFRISVCVLAAFGVVFIFWGVLFMWVSVCVCFFSGVRLDVEKCNLGLLLRALNSAETVR